MIDLDSMILPLSLCASHAANVMSEERFPPTQAERLEAALAPAEKWAAVEAYFGPGILPHDLVYISKEYCQLRTRENEAHNRIAQAILGLPEP